MEKPRDRDTHPLVLLAGQLIDELNQRYKDSAGGSFLMLHRHRIFNARQGVWMGWERKRGKLLDLNRLIMGGHGLFPYKAGDTAVLNGMRYILTLDSDTKLPRDSVQRMVGAMAHPLNRAILDPYMRIVTQGYGLMQPRVGITYIRLPAPAWPPFTPARPGSTFIPGRFRTYIRIFTEKASSPERVCMRFKFCMRCWIAGSRRIPC